MAAADVSALSKRKLLTKAKRAFFGVAKGPDYAPAFAKQEAELTIAMLQSGDWKTAKLKAYVDPPPPLVLDTETTSQSSVFRTSYVSAVSARCLCSTRPLVLPMFMWTCVVN